MREYTLGAPAIKIMIVSNFMMGLIAVRLEPQCDIPENICTEKSASLEAHSTSITSGNAQICEKELICDEHNDRARRSKAASRL